MKQWFKSLHNRFLKLNYREKFLLLLFTVSFMLVWLSSCCHQTKTLIQNWKLVSAKLKNLNFWIKNESIINANLDKMLDIMDPKKTLSGATFAGEVENIIRVYDLNYSMTSPRTRRGDIFNAHTLQLHCENASMDALIRFEEDVYAKKPYLSLEKVKLHANLFNPELLEVDFSLSALQLKDITREK